MQKNSAAALSPQNQELNSLCSRLLELLLDITVTLVCSGSHSGKTIRILKRFAKPFGFEVYVMLQTKSVSLTLLYSADHRIQQTAIRHIPGLHLNFYFQNMLSRLSWEVCDNGMDLDRLDALYHEIVQTPRYSFYVIWLTTSLANMAFCRLFGGDAYAMLFVFLGTAIACYVRARLLRREIHHLFVLIITAFLSSLTAGCTELFQLGNTASIALATSVLFMIPGVPLINSLIEILEGHILNGLEKIMSACTIIVCIALGLLLTLVILGLENL